jgi:hypothetical protein
LKKLVKYLLLSVLLQIGNLVFSQDTNSTLDFMNYPVFRINTHYGFVWSHHNYMNHLVESHFMAYEVNYGQQTNGLETWHHIYNFPEIGLGYWYSGLGSSSYLGEAHGIFPYINFPYTSKRNFRLSFKLGLGIGYATDKFHYHDNYKNMAIGSPFNVFGYFRFQNEHNLPLHLNYGIGLSHLSNGAVKAPNRGLNILTFHVGIKGALGKIPHIDFKEDIIPEVQNERQWRLMAGMGIKENYSAIGEQKPAYTLGGTYTWRVDHKRWIGPGVDLFYDISHKSRLAREGDTIKYDIEVLRPAVNFQHRWQIDKLDIVLQLGGYLYTRDKADGIFYNRLALQYNVYGNWIANVSLKSHWAKADFIEWGFLYKLKTVKE